MIWAFWASNLAGFTGILVAIYGFTVGYHQRKKYLQMRDYAYAVKTLEAVYAEIPVSQLSDNVLLGLRRQYELASGAARAIADWDNYAIFHKRHYALCAEANARMGISKP